MRVCVRVVRSAVQVHVSDSAIDGGAGRLQSVTDRHELDEFLCDALLKESEFEVQHSSMVSEQRKRSAALQFSRRAPLVRCAAALLSLGCA